MAGKHTKFEIIKKDSLCFPESSILMRCKLPFTPATSNKSDLKTFFEINFVISDICFFRQWLSLCLTHQEGIKAYTGDTKGGSITVLFTSCLTGLAFSVLPIKTKSVSCHTADTKPVKQEVNRTMILPLLVFPS
jgi:hypothetical protein